MLEAFRSAHFSASVREQLQQLMTVPQYRDASVSERTIVNFRSLQHFCQAHTFVVQGGKTDKEASVSDLAAQLPNPVREAFHDFTNSSITSSSQVRTTDGAVKTDRAYNEYVEDEEDGAVLILEEDKSIPAFDYHAEILQNKLRQRLRLFSNVYSQSFEGVEAILAKIAYQSIDLPEKPQWALIFGGRAYIIVFLCHVTDSSRQNRVALFCSPILSLYPGLGDLPITSVLLYLLLSGKYHTASTIQCALKISVPAVKALPSGRFPLFGTQILRSSRVLKSLGGFTSVGVQGNGTNVRILSPYSAREQCTNCTDIVLVDDPVILGGTGVIYKSSVARLVIKFSFPQLSKFIQNEASVYEHLEKFNIRYVPEFYGLFKWAAGVAIIISDKGESISTFDILEYTTKVTLYLRLRELHRCGVIHGDFAPRNVILDSGEVSIVDFSHAQIGHHCNSSCEELLAAKEVLFGSQSVRFKSSNYLFWRFDYIPITALIVFSVAVLLTYKAATLCK